MKRLFVILLVIVFAMACSESQNDANANPANKSVAAAKKKEAVKLEPSTKPVSDTETKKEEKPLVTPGKTLYAIMETSMGTIEIKLFPDSAPE